MARKPKRPEVIYPVMNTLPSGRRQVGMNSKGQPAKDPEHSSGYVCHPDDLPNHKLRKAAR